MGCCQPRKSPFGKYQLVLVLLSYISRLHLFICCIDQNQERKDLAAIVARKLATERGMSLTREQSDLTLSISIKSPRFGNYSVNIIKIVIGILTYCFVIFCDEEVLNWSIHFRQTSSRYELAGLGTSSAICSCCCCCRPNLLSIVLELIILNY